MLLVLLSKFTSLVVEIRNFLYDKGILPIVRSDYPVISIGNISLGGTGKTPFTILLATHLLKNNIKPVILSRGYKRKDKKIQVVTSNKDKIFYEQVGDEMYLVLQKLKIPIIVSQKKYKAVPYINKMQECEVVLVDDGFQHRRLYRDLDIVLIDKDTLVKPYLFPKGRLREPLKNLCRADFILVEDATGDLKVKGLNQLSNKTLCYRKVIKDFYDINGDRISFQEISKEKVALVSAIGKNENFNLSLQKLGLKIVYHLKFQDHHYYTPSDIDYIISRLKKQDIIYLVTTEKDFVKLKDYKNKFFENGITLITAVLELEVEKIELILETIQKLLSSYTKAK